MGRFFGMAQATLPKLYNLHSSPYTEMVKKGVWYMKQIMKQEYVEIKCQLDATEVSIADLTACSACFGHHYAHHQELKSIIQWLLPVVFRAVVFKLLVWCGAESYVSGLQDAPNPQLHSRPTT